MALEADPLNILHVHHRDVGKQMKEGKKILGQCALRPKVGHKEADKGSTSPLKQFESELAQSMYTTRVWGCLAWGRAARNKQFGLENVMEDNMSMNNRKIAGFMSAESIYSLAFYIVMVAAIAGVGAGVLSKKDSAKAASAISLLRANFVAESATLGYAPVAGAANIIRLSGNLLEMSGTDAIMPGGGIVTMGLRTTTFPSTGFTINVVGLTKPDVCNAIGGVGYGTWSAFAARKSALPASTAIINTASAPFTAKSAAKALCDAAAAGTAAVNMIFASY